MKRAYTYDIRHRPPNATIFSTRISSTRPIKTSIPDKVPMGEAATVSLDEYLHRADWTGSMIGYAADCITLDNLMASSGIYGEVDSPILDLSAGGGKVNIEMRARALNAASLSIFLMKYNADSKWGFHDEISSIKLWEPNSLYDPLTENWTDYNYTIEGGRDDAFLALQAYGYGAKVQIDRLAISQDLNAGESVTVPFIRYIGSELCALVDAANEHIGSSDAFEFKVRAAYLPDNDNERNRLLRLERNTQHKTCRQQRNRTLSRLRTFCNQNRERQNHSRKSRRQNRKHPYPYRH